MTPYHDPPTSEYNDDDDPNRPPARPKSYERAAREREDDERRAEETVARKEAKENADGVNPKPAPDRPRCLGYGPAEGDEYCDSCTWRTVCETAGEPANFKARANWQADQARLQAAFSGYHKAIYSYRAPNLHAVPGIYRQVQVTCRRGGVRPGYFLLFKLLEAYQGDPNEKFRLEPLPGDWLGFLALKRQLIIQEGNFDARTICSFWERDDLRDAILSVTEPPKTLENGRIPSSDEQDATTPRRHIFARSVAEAFEGDIRAALLYQHFRFWTDYYRDQRDARHNKDGRFWRYDSLDALAEKFPYMSRTTISRKVNKLLDAGYLERGNYNWSRMDKTRWFHAKAKDLTDEPIEPGGNIALGLDDAVALKSAAQACVLEVIRRKINKNRKNGRGPAALISVAEIASLLPCSPRTIRCAIDRMLCCEKIGLREKNPPADYVDPAHPFRQIDRRLKPRIYHFGNLPASEEEPEMISCESETDTY